MNCLDDVLSGGVAPMGEAEDMSVLVRFLARNMCYVTGWDTPGDRVRLDAIYPSKSLHIVANRADVETLLAQDMIKKYTDLTFPVVIEATPAGRVIIEDKTPLNIFHV